MKSSVKRPLLRYFGGKWQLRHWIIDNLPTHDFYAEPFAGAASVLLAKAPAAKGEILNDLNRDVINLFRVMQDQELSGELIRRLEWTPHSAAELELSQDAPDCPIEKARRMLIRSFMGIEVAGVKGSRSGLRMGNVDLRRLDQDGKRTFRNCAKDWSNWKDHIEMIRERLRDVMIYERDALEFIRLMDSPDCLMYIDPPYHPETRSGTRYAVDFDGSQHDLLVARILECDAKIVLSGYQSEAYSVLLDEGWKRVDRKSRANMSLRSRTESLWLSPNCDV